MGMDVYGDAPTSPEGEYFRNNVWSWRPLWDYCAEIAPDIITPEMREAGHYNDGRGLAKAGAEALADALAAEIASGRTARYAVNRDAALAALPKHRCQWCDGTGARTDAVGKQHGLDKPGGCNACHGKGEIEDDATHYPFSVENVQEFQRFLAACGGFQIH